MSEQLIFINRRSGVAHADFWCDALDGVPTECLRVEAYDPDRPRRKCPRCWNGYPGGGGHCAARGRGRRGQSGGSRVTWGEGLLGGCWRSRGTDSRAPRPARGPGPGGWSRVR